MGSLPTGRPLPGATSYQLDVATDAGFASLVAGYGSRNVGNVTSYDVTGIPIGIYFYRLRGVNSESTVSGNFATTTVDMNAAVSLAEWGCY